MILLTPIGRIRSPFKEPAEVPIQPRFSSARGEVEVFRRYSAGLRDIDGFSHIILLYHFDESRRTELLVRPYLDRQTRGVFATRSPHRPNHIGLSVVRLLRRRGSTLYVEGVDVIDRTPLFDIKPHVPQFDGRGDVRLGRLEGKLNGGGSATARCPPGNR